MGLRQLYLGIENDRTEGLLRRQAIPHTNVTGLWWATDTRREAFVDLFLKIDEHLKIVGNGQVVYRSFKDAVELSHKIRDAARFAVDQWWRSVPPPSDHITPECLLFFDVEAHQLLDREKRGITRHPFVEDPRDAFLAKQLIGQAYVIGRDDFGARVLPGFYRLTRPPGLVTARGEDAERWGDAGVEFESSWGGANPLVAQILAASHSQWAHCYTPEDEDELKNSSHYSYGYACARYHQRQFVMAGVTTPAHQWVLVDWVYTQMGKDVDEWMQGAKAAGWPGSFAVSGDWKSGSDDSPQTPEDQCAELVKEWTAYVATPYANLFGSED